MIRQARRMTIRDSHLVLHEATVPAATEWSVNPEAWLFLRVLHGEGFTFREKKPLLFGEGDTLVNAPGRPTLLRASQCGELRVQFFYVIAELLTGVISSSEQQHLAQAAQQGREFPRHLVAASPVAQQFAALGKQASADQTLLARCEMLRLSSQILTDHLPPPAPQPHQVLTAEQRFESMMKEQVESVWRHQSPEELARQCRCSVRHFSRLFRKHYGTSFVPKRIELSLQKAKQLLEETDAKIIDVAMESGFNHVGFFTSRFKQRFGCTPSVWRKRQSKPLKITGKRAGRAALVTV